MHGVTKEVDIPFAFEQDGTKGTFSGNFTLNREDYGIEGNMMGFMVGDDIEVTLRIPVSAR